MKNLSLQLILLLVFGLTACMDSNGRKGRPLIKDYSKDTTTASSTCYLVYSEWTQGTLLNYDHACETSCPTKTYIASDTEIAQVISSQSSATDKDTARAVLNEVAGLCMPDAIERPTGQVYVTKDYCSCIGTTPDIDNNCASYCATQSSTSQTAILHVNTTMGPDILNNSALGNLYNWCTAELSDTAPNCKLELYSSAGTVYYNVNLTSGSNSFTAEITNLTKGKTYVATLVEQNSGARSTSFHIYRKPTSDSTNLNGPIKLKAANLYSCIRRAGEIVNSVAYYSQATRLHYYYVDNKYPATVPAGETFWMCNAGGFPTDSDNYDRLELTPQAFTLWDESDIRFSNYNQTNTSKMYIQSIIENRLTNTYGVNISTAYPSGVKIFGEFRWPDAPSFTSSSTTAPRMGYYMQPWVDSKTQKPFCPTQVHYSGSDPLFRVLGDSDVIGVDTEAVFLAERNPLTLTTTTASGTIVSAAPQDVLIIREADLKKIWFYKEGGKPIPANSTTATQKQIMFYWPPKMTAPADHLTKGDNQVLYTVKNPTDLGTTTQTNISTGSLANTYLPADKRFGCVPYSGASKIPDHTTP